jgi:hypothetical protein
MRPKPPIGHRLQRALTIPGLAFGDSVNLALFLLTVLSLAIAVMGVHIAKKTLDDAHNEAEAQLRAAGQAVIDQKRAADQAEKHQRAEFDEQMKQLRSTSESLTKAAALLDVQKHIQNNLLATSQRQLQYASLGEKRATALPDPEISAHCGGLDFVNSKRQLAEHKRELSTYWWWDDDDAIDCRIYLRNNGEATLQKATLEFSISGCDIDTNQPGAVITVPQGGAILPNGLQGIHEEDIPPHRISEDSSHYSLRIKRIGKCDSFTIHLKLTSKNSATLFADGYVSTVSLK